MKVLGRLSGQGEHFVCFGFSVKVTSAGDPAMAQPPDLPIFKELSLFSSLSVNPSTSAAERALQRGARIH